MDLEDIGLKIKFARQNKGLTQKQLAEKIETSWEMISRYETGKSSPLNKISLISEALEIPLSTLLVNNNLNDSELAYTPPNRIPLITSIEKDLNSIINKSKLYYSCPDWIYQKYPNSFAIKAELITISSTKLEPQGIIYATQRNIVGNNILVLVNNETNGFQITSKKNIPSQSKVIATVIAWEKTLI